MSSDLKNLSSYKPEEIPSAEFMRVGIVISEWNTEITGALLDGATQTLVRHGANPDNIDIAYVPGSYELAFGAQLMAGKSKYDAIICLGCVIQGDTKHFDFICDAASHGIMQVGLKFNLPVIFGVLTTNNMEQARDRSGGKHGNKGDEAAITAIKMAALQQEK